MKVISIFYNILLENIIKIERIKTAGKLFKLINFGKLPLLKSFTKKKNGFHRLGNLSSYTKNSHKLKKEKIC